MTPEQKQQALQTIEDWDKVTKAVTPAATYFKGEQMPALLQELINAQAKLLTTTNPAQTSSSPTEAPADVARDAERYRWLRNQNNSLETQQRDKGVINGLSCYHEVEGIRELKYDKHLDCAVDAAIERGKLKGGA